MKNEASTAERSHKRPAVLLVCISALLGSCRTTTNANLQSVVAIDAPAENFDYTTLTELRLGEEGIPRGEDAVFAGYASKFTTIHQGQQRANAEQSRVPLPNLRGMHAKGHGCVSGTFTATPARAALARGLFATTTPLPVTARFSNGSGLLDADTSRDLRGFAVKVRTGGPPDGYLSETTEPGVQDLLMTNGAVHHAQDMTELMKFTEAMAAGGLTRAGFLATHLRLARTLMSQTGRTVESLVNETYWSRAPFALGSEHVMKFMARPVRQRAARSVAGPDVPDRLSLDLVHQFETADEAPIEFDLLVQLQTNPTTEPIENHAVAWSSPTEVVGRISFPRQTPDRGTDCEKMQFNPWNALKEHRPLGNMNRARSPIYYASRRFRGN